MQSICVIGSMNIDLVIHLPRFHAPGETIIGHDFSIFTGGKGGNQAVALGRLGADVSMVGMVGQDDNGALYLRTLQQEHVKTDHVHYADQPTGVALIEVSDQSGDNRIALASGANMLLSEELLHSIWQTIGRFDYYLLQFETPMATTLAAAKRIRQAGKTLILDPAPAQQIDDDLLANVDYITPNETELHILTGLPTGTVEEIQRAAQALVQRGATRVVAKMGARGAMLVSAEGVAQVPGFVVKAIDTTAAGDSFNAGLAFALSQGKTPVDAVRYANAVGAISTTSFGAQSAMPTREQVEALMRESV